MIHVIDVVPDSFSILFRSHKYSPIEKIYSVALFITGLSIRDLSERLCLTGASRELVRIWVHRFSSLSMPSRRVRRLVAIAAMHNIIRAGGEEVILTCQYRHHKNNGYILPICTFK
jgi:hypothetical protein